MIITIIGKTADGKVVAEDKSDSRQKAEQIAASWRGSGPVVEVNESTAG